MSDKEIFDRLLAILKNDLTVHCAITENTALIEEGILDSMDVVSYITRVEESFSVEISNADFDEQKLGSVMNMVAYLKMKVG